MSDMTNETVYVLRINHKFGSDTQVFANYEDAQKDLHEFVAENWDDVAHIHGALRDVENMATATEWYFEANQDETYDIVETTIQ